MGHSRSFHPSLSIRATALLLVATLLVACGVAIASAGGSKPKAVASKPKADNAAAQAALLLGKVARSKNPLKIASTALPTPMPPTAPPRRPVDATGRSRIYAAAIEWPYSYFAITRAPVARVIDSDDELSPFTLVRRNLISGERRVLLRSKHSSLVGLHAGGGRAYVGLMRFERHDRINSSILGFDHDAIAPAAVDSANLKFEEESPSGMCGRIIGLNGTTGDGAAIALRLTAVCATDHSHDFDSELLTIDRAGAARTLDTSPSIATVFFGIAESAGDHFVYHHRYGGSVTSVNAATGTAVELWLSHSPASASVAHDGTVAVGPAVGFENDDFTDEESSWADPIKNPFVIFPQGDSETPKPIADAGYRSVAMKFCGSQLYEIRLPRQPGYSETASELSLLGGLATVSDFEVWARDLAGNSPRLVGSHPQAWVRDIACDGESLVVATDQRVRVDVARFGP